MLGDELQTDRCAFATIPFMTTTIFKGVKKKSAMHEKLQL
jgi:hypothetical protein